MAGVAGAMEPAVVGQRQRHRLGAGEVGDEFRLDSVEAGRMVVGLQMGKVPVMKTRHCQ